MIWAEEVDEEKNKQSMHLQHKSIRRGCGWKIILNNSFFHVRRAKNITRLRFVRSKEWEKFAKKNKFFFWSYFSPQKCFFPPILLSFMAGSLKRGWPLQRPRSDLQRPIMPLLLLWLSKREEEKDFAWFRLDFDKSIAAEHNSWHMHFSRSQKRMSFLQR